MCTSGDFSKTAREALFKKNLWSNIYCFFIDFIVKKKALEQVHLEEQVCSESAVRKSTDSNSFSHTPVASKCICLLKLSVHPLQWSCIEQLFLVHRKSTVIG